MDRFLDTSVLVPVFLGEHPHHTPSIRLLNRCTPETASCAAHSLAELYATLTRLPAPHRVSPDRAIKCIEIVQEHLRLIALSGEAHVSAIRQAAGLRIVGGTIYDTLIAHCGMVCGAKRIYTWNMRHFELLGEDVTSRLCTPADE